MTTQPQANLSTPGYANVTNLYMALELSPAKWEVWLSDGWRERRVVVPARDVARLATEIARAKAKFGLPATAAVPSVYEAGRDGFWIHRFLQRLGVESQVLDSASIEVERRGRRVKTDRVDGRKLLRLLLRQAREGEPLRVVYIPTVAAEDDRRLHREREQLLKERTQHRNRIRGLLALHGVEVGWRKAFSAWLATVRLWDGRPVPAQLQAEIGREYQRLPGVEQQLREVMASQRDQVRAARAAVIAAPPAPAAAAVATPAPVAVEAAAVATPAPVAVEAAAVATPAPVAVETAAVATPAPVAVETAAVATPAPAETGAATAPDAMRLVLLLSHLKGVGTTSAWILVQEFFGWRHFDNRRQVAAAAGLTGAPYASGDTRREQGISKTGNRRVRSLMVELAWCWLRFQPDSALSQWFRQRFGGGGSRARRIGIVALARRLLIALWRYVQWGELPAGAAVKAG